MECCICYTEIDATNIKTLSCSHNFHKSCVIAWFMNQKNSTTCPLCRSNEELNFGECFDIMTETYIKLREQAKKTRLLRKEHDEIMRLYEERDERWSLNRSQRTPEQIQMAETWGQRLKEHNQRFQILLTQLNTTN
jgi:hypothetical protein